MGHFTQQWAALGGELHACARSHIRTSTHGRKGLLPDLPAHRPFRRDLAGRRHQGGLPASALRGTGGNLDRFSRLGAGAHPDNEVERHGCMLAGSQPGLDESDREVDVDHGVGLVVDLQRRGSQSPQHRVDIAEYIRQGIDLILKQNEDKLPGQMSLVDR